jgi:hypothetical protein
MLETAPISQQHIRGSKPPDTIINTLIVEIFTENDLELHNDDERIVPVRPANLIDALQGLPKPN